MLERFRLPALTAFAAVSLAAASGLADIAPAAAQSLSQRLLVVVNDQPITDFDVTQRVRLNKALGYAGDGANQKKLREEALKELIDEVIKRTEAKRFKVEVKRQQLDDAVARMAQGSNMTVDQLKAKLKKSGVSIAAFEQQVEAGLLFRWMMRGRYNIEIKVDDAEVDQRHSTITSDPRMKPVTVYKMREITLPIEKVSAGFREQLFYARAIEAQQIMQKYKGCASASAAAKGIFNVKVGRVMQADASRLPPEMKSALDQAGTKRLIGPMRTEAALQLIGFCGIEKVNPPKPSKEVVRNMLLNEKYKLASERIMRDLRRQAYIDYKVSDAGSAQ